MIKWDLAGFEKLTREQLAKNMTKAGVYFTSKVRGYLNTSQPYRRTPSGGHRGMNPSAPGQFPKKLSGQLQRSITWNLDSAALVLDVGSNLKGYPAMLELGTVHMKARPWLTLAFEAEKDNIGRLILNG